MTLTFDLPTGRTDYARLLEITKELPPGAHLRLPGMLTPDEYAAIQRLKNSQFFLMRNNGVTTGERWGCRNHKLASPKANATTSFAKPKIHPFFTICCIPAPYRGLDKGLIKYVAVSHDPEAVKRLSPYVPELAHTHPEYARKLRPAQRGEDFYAFTLAVAQPITYAEAVEYANQITAVTGRRYTL